MGTRFKHKGTLMIPANKRDLINRELERNGYGPDNFSIPISSKVKGVDTITHYASTLAMNDAIKSIMEKLLKEYKGERLEKKIDVALKEKGVKIDRSNKQ